jgi:uncharacterized protein (DUF58 family)
MDRPPSAQACEVFGEDFLRRLERLHLLAKRLTAGRQAGVHRARDVGDGLEFADHRAYSAGDDPRFIDWPYFARMEKLLVRLFHVHSESDVGILLDTSASMAAGRGERFGHALRIAAALAYIGMGSGRRVRLQSFGERLGPSLRTPRSREGLFDVIAFLQTLKPAGKTDLLAAARRFAAAHADCDAVILLSDCYGCDEELGESLSLLTGPTLLHVFGPEDAQPDISGPLQFRDAESGREQAVDVSAALRESYRAEWTRRQGAIERNCREREALYVAATTDVPFEELIFTTLRRVGIVG